MMKGITALLFILFCSLVPIIAESQQPASPAPLAKQSLPKEAMGGKYRVQIMEAMPEQLEEMQKAANEFSAKYRQNAYIVSGGKTIQLQTGDYPDKKFAKLRQQQVQRDYKKTKIVKALNESILAFTKYEKPRPGKIIPSPGPPVKQETQYKTEAAQEIPHADFEQWKAPEYLAANTAQNEDYLTAEEKQVYYYLNLARMNPKLFADTYLGNIKDSKDSYESSLYKELQQLKPLSVLKPDRALFESAQCHAVESGKSGYVGHDRVKCKQHFMGECCHYGESGPLEIVTLLLIDHNVPSLGHRKICLGNYTQLGVAIRPHKAYGKNAVLDFE